MYLGGDYYSAGAVLVRDNGGAWQLFYINSDYLGSITHIVNAAGSVVAEYSYDAWGKLRDANTLQVYAIGHEPELFLGRGYTGHEHLPWFELINMNARLYDPVHGRFLAPDPYVQAPDMTQSFNRYSYVLNNPLTYVDENGEFWHIVIGAIVGGVINLAMNWNNIDNFWQGLAYFGVGAAGGALAAATGGGTSALLAGGSFGAGALGTTTTLATAGIINGATIGASSGLMGGMVNGFGNVTIEGASFGQALNAGINGAVMGAIGGGLTGGITGGIQAKIQGKNVWNGENIKPKVNVKIEPLIDEGFVLDNNPKSWGYERTAVMRDSEGLIKSIAKTEIRFGHTENNVYHAFRHIDAAGLDRSQVASSILKDFVPKLSTNIPTGQTLNYSIFVSESKIIYTVHRLPSGIYNIGRIVVR